MTNQPAGQNWLRQHLKIATPKPAVLSFCGQTARKRKADEFYISEFYPASYAPADTVCGHLKFALKNEPLDMGVISQTMHLLDPSDLTEWIRQEPNGAYSRRAWFLYEWFTGERLDLPDAGTVTYVSALDPSLNIGALGINSPRHKVTNNMFGVPDFCLTIRATNPIAEFSAKKLKDRLQATLDECESNIIRRVRDYCFAQEAKASFEIEREYVMGSKAERFIRALENAGSFDTRNKKSFIDLQNMIVDSRYAAENYRDFQNFVGQTITNSYEKVHFICPKPEDLNSLMAGWSAMVSRARGAYDPVVVAASTAFSFVFLHPFDDGNGRIHRFLIHSMMCQEGFTPPNFLLPISAAILRDQKGYEDILQSFSRPLFDFIDWHWTLSQTIHVSNRTDHLYRYLDITKFVEFLYQKLEEVITKTLGDDIRTISIYDRAYRLTADLVDMPNRKLSMFIDLCIQNDGQLPKRKREIFNELGDDELANLERSVKSAMNMH